MNTAMLDWDDLRFFLAIARHKNLARAAKELQVTQSTVGRRLASLQAGLGARLLQRTTTGYVLTPAGESIRTHVERVESETLSVQRAVNGQDVRLEGLVRVASSQLLASHLLAPCFAALQADHESIVVEAVPEQPEDAHATLDDADVTVRLRPFDHHDLIVRNLGPMQFGLYACVAYLAQHGEPQVADGCTGHRLITLVHDDVLPEQAAWIRAHAGNAQVVLRTDSHETQLCSAAFNGGLAILPRFRADREPSLKRIDMAVPIPSAEIWIAVHRENRHVPRIRVLLDVIGSTIRTNAAMLSPGSGVPDQAV